MLKIVFGVCAGVTGYTAWQLCFEDTTLGGWIPFLLLSFGPFFGLAVGLAICHFKEYAKY